MYKDIAVKYAEDCINDSITSCKKIKQACEIFLEVIRDPDYYIDETELIKIIKFSERLYLTEQSERVKLKLQPFQIFFLFNIFAIKRRDNKQCLYKNIYLEIARGNAKSQICVIIAAYFLLFGNDEQIIVASDTIKNTTEIDFEKASKILKQIDPSGKEIRIYPHYSNIKFKNNRIIMLSDQGKNADGLSVSTAILDEFHRFKTLNIYNSVRTALAKRRDSRMIVITTAGDDLSSQCYKLHQYCEKVLNREVNDRSQLALIYTLDDNDDFSNKEVWRKPNPLLDIAVDSVAIENAVNKALVDEQEKNATLSRHFNLWVKPDSTVNFIDYKYVKDSYHDLKISDFPECETFCGVDLSENNDLTSVSYLIIKDDIFHFFNDYYTTQDSLNTQYNKERYREAAKKGEIKILPGTAIDYSYIVDDIKKINQKNKIKIIAYDKYKAKFLVKELEKEFNMFPFSQLASSMHTAITEMQRLLLLGRLKIQSNSLTDWMYFNILIETTNRGLLNFNRTSRNNKIDGFASMADALGGYLDAPEYGVSVF